MGEVKLTTEGIKYIALFESLTGAVTKDCVIDEDNDRVIFVVKKGDVGLAIGKRGVNIARVKKTIGKNVEVIEHSEDPVEFVKNLFTPIKIKNVNIMDKKEGKTIALIDVYERDKGLVIGKGGKNIKKAKMLVRRHHNIDDVQIT